MAKMAGQSVVCCARRVATGRVVFLVSSQVEGEEKEGEFRRSSLRRWWSEEVGGVKTLDDFASLDTPVSGGRRSWSWEATRGAGAG